MPRYLLNNKQEVVVCSESEHREWLAQKPNRDVAIHRYGKTEIKTIFLKYHEQDEKTGEDMPFETLVSTDGKEVYRKNYANWNEAEQGHIWCVKEYLGNDFIKKEVEILDRIKHEIPQDEMNKDTGKER